MKHTPGPWEWFGNLKTKQVYLATPDRGRLFVMSFGRYGMQRAQPLFRQDGFMADFHEFVTREVPYRDDWYGINHPDARLIKASPDLLEALEDCCTRMERCRSILQDPKCGGNPESNWGILDTQKARAAIAKAEPR